MLKNKQVALCSHSVFSTLILTLLIFPDFHNSFSISCGIYYVTETEEILKKFEKLNFVLVDRLVISGFLHEGQNRVLQCGLIDSKQGENLQTQPSLDLRLSTWVASGPPSVSPLHISVRCFQPFFIFRKYSL